MPETHETFQFVADRGDARSRLDRILVRRLTSLSQFSRSRAQEWIEAGAVTVNGARAHRAAMRVPEGAAIGVSIPLSARFKARPQSEPVPLTVLYEDAELLVVNKPAGMIVHPSYKRTSGTLLNGVLWHLRSRDQPRPGIVTRLDKDTSGLVLVALTAEVHAAFQRDQPRRIRKEYAAVVRGWPRPPEGRIRHALARDPLDRRRMVVAADGAASETRYELLEQREAASGPESLVRCELVTGRTHQIRVHLAAEGWPIVGDLTYGCADERIARQALHAWRLSFTHPVTRRAVDVEAPIPEDMRALLH